MNAMVGGYVGIEEVVDGDGSIAEESEKGKEKGKCWIGKSVKKVEEGDEKDDERDEGTPVPSTREEHTIEAPLQNEDTIEAPPESEADGDDEDDDEFPEGMEPRPEITKAIDVWALGVTLYCLLMGRCPWTGNSEFSLYINLRSDDFDVEETMGIDKIPTGGRHHEEGDTSEGAVVVSLLERLLEKDYKKRITLEEVKVCVGGFMLVCVVELTFSGSLCSVCLG
jgi:hypothetical protein